MSRRILQTPTGESVELEHLVSQGAEAEVWTVWGQPTLAAKLFYAQVLEERDGWYPSKVAAMLATPPAEPDPQRISIAWPLVVLYENEQFTGYLVPWLANSTQVSYALEVRAARRRDLPFLTTRDFYWSAAGLADAVMRLHHAGHLVGDFSPDHLRWREDHGLALVDADAFQIAAPGGRIFRNELPPAEFMPPELQGEDPRSIQWLPVHDHFALAVHVFELLMEVYPFAGVLPDGTVPPELHLQHLRHGYFPHAQTGGAAPPPHLRGRFRCLSPALQNAFERAFIAGHGDPAARPDAEEWRKLLSTETDQLVTCPRCREFYAPSFAECPYCRARRAEVQGACLKWLLAGGAALFFMLGLVAIGAWALLKLHPLSRPVRPTPRASPTAIATPAPPAVSNSERFPVGKIFSTTLELDPGSPRSIIVARSDHQITFSRRPVAGAGAPAEFVVSWGTGSAVMVADRAEEAARSLRLRPAAPLRAAEGWREVELTVGAQNDWVGTYRVGARDLGWRVTTSRTEPGSVVEDVTPETPASDAGLQRGDRLTRADSAAAVELDEFAASPELQQRGEITLRAFRGPTQVVNDYIAAGDFKYRQTSGDFVIVERVGPLSRAEAAGLRKGDVIVKIAGINTRQIPNGRLAGLLNQVTTLEVYREAQVLPITLSCDKQLRLSFPPPR